MRLKILFILLLSLVTISACNTVQEDTPITVFLVADGSQQQWSLSSPMTVGEFLRAREIELGPLDRVSHSDFTQLTDKMRITVVRITEITECVEEDIPFSPEYRHSEGIQPGTQIIGQAGKNGVQQICYRVTIEDGVRSQPTEIDRTTLIEPKNEIIYVSPPGEIEPVAVNGTLAYVSGGNAWIIRGSSTNKRPLTTTSDLDSRVFSVTNNGRSLLFSSKTPGSTGTTFQNQLWLISDTGLNDPVIVKLPPENVLYADWVPARENTISYSSGEARDTAPGWKALNDLWIMRIDPVTGGSLNMDEVLKPSTIGAYPWWGNNYEWSPDGDKLAWVRADAIGLVDFENNEMGNPLLSYTFYRTSEDWSWRSSVAWSPDSAMLIAPVHGPPLGSEAPDTSPAFDLAVADIAGRFSATIVKSTGMWSSPKYSTIVSGENTQFPQGYLAYLQARDIGNSIRSLAPYDLIVADRDGSNTRKIFPSDGQAGLTAQEIVWSPDGRQIAFIYAGNLWIIDVESEVAHQLTLDGAASKPVWTQ